MIPTTLEIKKKKQQLMFRGEKDQKETIQNLKVLG